ncbi:hypothetical protein BH10BAC3_BH10BAC3_04400 [soil metagenome]
MSKQNFEKFINVKIKGAKKKEKIKQEKKVVKKEREAYFIEKKRELRAAKKLQNEPHTRPAQFAASKSGGQSSSTGKPDKRGKHAAKYAGKNKKSFDDKKPDDYEQPKNVQPAKQERRQFSLEKKNAATADNRKSSEKIVPAKAASTRKPLKEKTRDIRPDTKKTTAPTNDKRPAKKAYDAGLPYERKPITKAVVLPDPAKKKAIAKPKSEEYSKPVEQKPTRESRPSVSKPVPALNEPILMPLNKYIAHGGICSRRDAGELVKSGKVKVNGQVVIDPGFKVKEGDDIVANGKKVTPQHNLVYILLNKPKDFITTVEDPQGRKTVLDIVKSATNERIYPVGRLDRNTSGVLLLTNDGELAQHLTHPSFEVRKIYEAKLDKLLSKADFDKLIDGVELEDGKVHADSLAYADSKDKSIIGIEIHSGRNRVVRRMFEHLGYDVKGLDRVLFANLTKKNVERGKWRFLNDKEVRLLKFFNKSKQ